MSQPGTGQGPPLTLPWTGVGDSHLPLGEAEALPSHGLCGTHSGVNRRGHQWDSLGVPSPPGWEGQQVTCDQADLVPCTTPQASLDRRELPG